MYHYRIICYLLMGFAATGCSKFLDEKPDQGLVIAGTVADYQALLDNNTRMNNYVTGVGEASSDNYYLTYANWQSLLEANRNTYIWGADIYAGITVISANPWVGTYSPVYYANVCLEGLPGVPRTASNAAAWDNVRGSALFYRGRAHFLALVNWAKAYDAVTAGSDPGVPLRLVSDFNERSVRSSIGDSYRQVLADLKASVVGLPVVPANGMRPSRPAAYGLMARVYLTMGDFVTAKAYADSCLALKNDLLDYNGLTASAAFPVAAFNKETLFYASAQITAVSPTYAKIDSVLYKSYGTGDLRKGVFFQSNGDGSYRFKGFYTGSTTMFTGMSVAEVVLMRAECLARMDSLAASLAALNSLLKMRWDKNTFVPVTAVTPAAALDLILVERRKELVMRDLRWMDLKRLNRESGRGVTITRNLNGTVTVLPPNDPRYALPLPESVVAISGMAQNPR